MALHRGKTAEGGDVACPCARGWFDRPRGRAAPGDEVGDRGRVGGPGGDCFPHAPSGIEVVREGLAVLRLRGDLARRVIGAGDFGAAGVPTGEFDGVAEAVVRRAGVGEPVGGVVGVGFGGGGYFGGAGFFAAGEFGGVGAVGVGVVVVVGGGAALTDWRFLGLCETAGCVIGVCLG